MKILTWKRRAENVALPCRDVLSPLSCRTWYTEIAPQPKWKSEHPNPETNPIKLNQDKSTFLMPRPNQSCHVSSKHSSLPKAPPSKPLTSSETPPGPQLPNPQTLPPPNHPTSQPPAPSPPSCLPPSHLPGVRLLWKTGRVRSQSRWLQDRLCASQNGQTDPRPRLSNPSAYADPNKRYFLWGYFGGVYFGGVLWGCIIL